MKNTEIAHVWASRQKDSGKNGNIRFDNTGIYSYNFQMASFRRTNDNSLVVFVNFSAQSNTTTNHINKIISSVTHYNTYVYNIIPEYAIDADYITERSVNESRPNHINPLDIWNQYHQIYQLVLASTLIKKYSKTLAKRLDCARMYARDANRLAIEFNLELPELSVVIDDNIQSIIDSENKRIADNRVKRFNKTQENRDLWLAGKIANYPDAIVNPVVLRINPLDNTEVETSRSAMVPLSVCNRLYKTFKCNMMPDDLSVGKYKLRNVSLDNIQIGCHTILADELERFADIIGLK